MATQPWRSSKKKQSGTVCTITLLGDGPPLLGPLEPICGFGPADCGELTDDHLSAEPVQIQATPPNPRQRHSDTYDRYNNDQQAGGERAPPCGHVPGQKSPTSPYEGQDKRVQWSGGGATCPCPIAHPGPRYTFGPTSREAKGDMETTKRVWVAATLDTKSDEANYVCKLLEAAGVPVALADLSTSGSSVPAATRIHFSSEDIAAYHPQSGSAVFTGDRGTAIAAMSDAFERFVKSRNDIGGMLGLGGSGGTALITRAMRALPIRCAETDGFDDGLGQCFRVCRCL